MKSTSNFPGLLEGFFTQRLLQQKQASTHKRYDRVQIHFLSHAELDALLAAPELETWSGRRDHALLMVAVQTGLRLSELNGLEATRCHGRYRRSCALYRERTEGEMYPTDQANQGRVEKLVE